MSLNVKSLSLSISYNFVDILIEPVVLAEYQQNDQRHVDVIGRAVRGIVQRLQDGNHLKEEKKNNIA